MSDALFKTSRKPPFTYGLWTFYFLFHFSLSRLLHISLSGSLSLTSRKSFAPCSSFCNCEWVWRFSWFSWEVCITLKACTLLLWEAEEVSCHLGTEKEAQLNVTFHWWALLILPKCNVLDLCKDSRAFRNLQITSLFKTQEIGHWDLSLVGTTVFFRGKLALVL